LAEAKKTAEEADDTLKERGDSRSGGGHGMWDMTPRKILITMRAKRRGSSLEKRKRVRIRGGKENRSQGRLERRPTKTILSCLQASTLRGEKRKEQSKDGRWFWLRETPSRLRHVTARKEVGGGGSEKGREPCGG